MESDIKILQQEYWQGLKSFLEANNSSVRITKPLPQNWLNIRTGKGDIYFAVAVNSNTNELYVWLVLSGVHGKDNFDNLKKIAFENSFKEVHKDLVWDRMEGRLRSAVTLTKNADFRVKSEWNSQYAWFKENVDKFAGYFKPLLSKL